MNPVELPIRDLHLPDPVSFWPLAPGWWVLIALAVTGFVLLLRKALQARRESAARRLALRQLKQHAEDYMRHGNAVRFGTELSELLRRTMLAYAPRQEVAGLTGEEWLSWLDRDLDRSHFLEGDGRPLIEWPYRDPDLAVDKSDVAALVDAVRLRLETPVGGRS